MRRRPVLFAAALALVPYALLAWRFRFTCDDAYITFRYARHLAAGAGLIFNPGESPPVEGYSNFLWTALLALPHLFGLAVEPCANLLSATAGFALVIWVARFAADRLGLCAAGTAAAALFTATLPTVVVWATGGLETLPFALAVFAVFASLATDPGHPRERAAALAVCAAVLLRADGFLFVALALAAAWLAGARPRALTRAALAGALVLAAHFLWRHAYYGEWLPNTARVKTGLSLARLARGGGYLASLVLAMPALAVVVAAGARLAAGELRRVGLAAQFFVLANAAYAAYVGGDFMAMGRFLAPAMPFLALVFAAASTPWRPRARLAWAASLVAFNVLGCFDLLGVPAELRQRVHFRWNTPEARSEVEQWAEMKANGEELALLGRALALETAPGESMIRSSVGAVGYFTGLFLFDRNGLVSPEVVDGSAPLERASPGHDRRVEPEFFFDRRPNYYGAKLVEPGGAALGHEAQELAAAGRLEVLLRPLPEGGGFPQGSALQLLRLRWSD